MTFTCLGFCSSNASLYTFAITDTLDISRSSYSLAKTMIGVVITMMIVIAKGAKIRKSVIEEYENSIRVSEAKV